MPNTGGFWFTPLELLEKIKEVDGVGSGLDADVLRGKTFEEYIISPFSAQRLFGEIGRFESDSNSDGVADGWTLTHTGTVTSVTGSLVTDSTEGSYAQKIDFYAELQKAHVYLTSDFVQVDPSFPSVLMLDYKATSELAGTLGLTVSIIYYDSNHTEISSESLTLSETDTYKSRVKELSIPANASYIKIEVHMYDKSGAGGPLHRYLYLDNLRIVGVKDIDFSNLLVSFFFPEEVTSVNDLMTSEPITNRYGVTKTGYEWIEYLAGTGDGIYTRHFVTSVNVL